MKLPTVGIATDGAHSTKEKLTRYRAVDLSSGLSRVIKCLSIHSYNMLYSILHNSSLSSLSSRESS